MSDSEMSKKLIVMVGLPRSGKSTWARNQRLFPIVNPDSIRIALHGQPFLPSMEPYVWAIAKTMVKSLFLAGHTIVILDACNVTKKRRQEWVSPEWKTYYKGIPTPVNVCFQRCGEDNEPLWKAIERMWKEFEGLSSDEPLWEGTH